MKSLLFTFLLILVGVQLHAQVNVYFDFDQHTLLATEQEKLKEINIANIEKVVAYTDSVGTTKYNKILASKRLATVLKLLNIENISATKLSSTKASNLPITYIAHGETTDAASNALNRRVSISFKPIEEKKEVVAVPPKDSVQAPVETIKVKRRIQLPNIYFYPSTDRFKPESSAALLFTLDEAKKIENEKVEIRGHINHPSHYAPIEAWQVKLSWQRAQAVYNYLKNNGVNMTNFTVRGMSNTEMVYPHATTPVEMQKNMRVEFVIIE